MLSNTLSLIEFMFAAVCNYVEPMPIEDQFFMGFQFSRKLIEKEGQMYMRNIWF